MKQNKRYKILETWELDFEWLHVQHRVKDMLNHEKLPDLNAILMLIGIQELGIVKKFSKDEKQDLMHIAVCSLMAKDGYFEPEPRDEDGWLHFKPLKKFEQTGEKPQETYLKMKVIEYFKTF